MVRTLSDSLEAALSSITRTPALTLTAEDHVLHYRLDQNPGADDCWHDACIASDNSIVRVRLARAPSSFAGSLQIQRISDPLQAAQWSNAAWTTLPGAGGVLFQDGGCALSNSGGVLRAFAQRGSGGNELWVWTSSDQGLSWSGPATVLTPPGNALLKGISSAGNQDVFFLYDVSGGEALGCSFLNGGSWSALKSWTLPPLAGGAGLAAVFASSFYTLIYSDGYTLASCTFNPATGQWSAGVLIAPATSSAINRFAPRIGFADGLYTLACVEADTGSLTGAVYSYPRLRQSADLLHWSNGSILHDLTCTYGAVPLRVPGSAGGTGARSYLVSMPTIFSAPTFVSTNPQQCLDLSGAVLSYQRLEAPGRPARLEVLLDNAAGRYNNLVTIGSTYQPLGPGSSLILSEGYLSGSPPTASLVRVGTYYLAQLHFLRSPQENRLLLVAFDGSYRLDFCARYQNDYTNQTLGFLITEVCARAGLFALTLPATGQTSQIIPAFVIHAGRPYRAALNELCTTYGLVYFLDENEVLHFRELASSDTAVWAYEPEIELVSFGRSDQRANHIIVSGKPPAGGLPQALTTAEVYDDTHLHLVGNERLLHHVDPRLTSTNQCAQKAAFLMAQAQRAAVQHTIVVPLNPALQLFDCLTLTDSAAPGGSGQQLTCRIQALTACFIPQQGRCELHLALAGL
jgi:hypothetical protein